MDIQLILNKLLEKTKSNSLKWFYLDTHKRLSDCSLTFFNDGYNRNNSFYANINNGFFVLVDYKSNFYLTVFPTLESREVTTINASKNGVMSSQDELLRLLNLIKKQYPQVDDIVADLMNDNF